MTITQKLLKDLFVYDDGRLIRLVRAGRFNACTVAGSKNHDGYWFVGITGKKLLLHRVIFLWHHGYLPKMIDHIDRDPSNNRIENLRECTATQNQLNRTSVAGSSSKYKGVRWLNSDKRWIAQTQLNGEYKYIGSFKSEKDAAIAYNKYAKDNHGEYATLNVLGDAE